MKKLLAICSALAMLSLNANSVWAEKIGESYFADDFENQTDWVSLAGKGWTSDNGGAVNIIDGKYGKCAYINAYWGSSLDSPVPENTADYIGISFDMMMNKRSVDGVYFQKKQGENVSLDYLLNFQWKYNAYEVYAYNQDIYNTAPVYKFEYGQWINVKMLLDIKHQNYSVNITDENGISKNIIVNQSIPIDSTLASIKFFNPKYGQYAVPETDVGDFYLDNFDMYPEMPDESEDFEGVSIINDAVGWESSNGAGVSITSENNNKYLDINSLWENTVTKRFRDPTDKNIVIDMKLKAEQPKGQFLRILTGEDNNNYKNFLCLNQNENGENQIIYCYGENVWNIAPVTFESNKWFNLKIVVNNDTKIWYGYVNTDPDNGGEEQLVFWDSIADIDKIYGLQIFYPLHWNPDKPDDATNKSFGIDDFDTSLFNGEISYSMTALLTAADGTTITDKQGLLNVKDQNPAVNIKVSRKTYGEMLPAYAAAAVYQDGKLVCVDMNNSFALTAMNTEKTVTLNPDFSKLNKESNDIEVKAFFWQGNNLMPLTTEVNIFGE